MKMKKLLLAILATAAFSGSAYAADLAARPYAKAPPMVAPAPSFTGCYIGAGIGYGLLDDERSGTSFGSPLPLSTSAAKGWLGSIGGGCDYQFAGVTPFGPLVLGAFADWDPSNIKGNFGDPVNDAKYGVQKLSSAWFVGGRAGLVVMPNVLTYVSGGWTGARIDQINLLWNDGTSANLYLPAQTAHGWFLGSGMEYAFTFLPIKGLFWKNEYRYSRYEGYDQNYVHPTFVGTRNTVHNSVDVQTITTSLVWRFGTP